jgi:hypothetical protein
MSIESRLKRLENGRSEEPNWEYCVCENKVGSEVTEVFLQHGPDDEARNSRGESFDGSNQCPDCGKPKRCVVIEFVATL